MTKWFFLWLLLLVPQIATAQILTQTRLLEPPGNHVVGEPLSLMATITADYGTPTGEVEFFRRGRSQGAAPLIPLRVRQGTVAAGMITTCAIESDGAVLCWGSGPLGGELALHSQPTPAPVVGLPGPAYQVSVRYTHACALTDEGGVWCWGDNTSGQLGTTALQPGFSASNTAVPVAGLQSGVVEVQVGHLHSCAVTDTGALYCWGQGGYGQLGDGAFEDRFTPVAVEGLPSGAVSVATGEGHTCALTEFDGIFCFGRNWYGQLGADPETVERSAVPLSVPGTVGARQLATGTQHGCYITPNRRVRCWGRARQGQLGDGNIERMNHNAVRVSRLRRVDRIFLGPSSSFAIRADGRVFHWGAIWGGVNGDFENTVNPIRVRVGIARRFTPWSISNGGSHTCVQMARGAIQCWGSNQQGRLGIGHDEPNAYSRTPVVGGNRWWQEADAFARLDPFQIDYPGRYRFNASYGGSADHAASNAWRLYLQVTQ